MAESDLLCRIESGGSRLMARFESKFEKTKGCWLWKGAKHKQGYGKIVVLKKIELAHRVAFILYKNESLKDSECVLHKCDVVCCVRPAHLKKGTQLDNIRDRDEKNRQAVGERASTARLTARQVKEIRRRYDAVEPVAFIAAMFGIHRDTVYSIGRRKTWQHMKEVA